MADFAAAIRPATETDHGFVIGFWLESYWRDAVPRRKGRGGETPHCDWKLPAKVRVRVLLAKDVTLVAHDPDDADRLYGFVCGGHTSLHFVFVRETRRRGGLGRELLAALERERGGPYDLRATTYVTRDWLGARDGMRGKAKAA